MALRCVEDYCRKFRLDDAEISAFLADWWNLPLVDGPDAFGRWEQDHADLTEVGLGSPYPDGYEQTLLQTGIEPPEFRQLLESIVEIGFSNFYGAPNHQETIVNATRAFQIARSHGIEPPDSTLFETSRWCDRQGWGNALTVAERDQWRSL